MHPPRPALLAVILVLAACSPGASSPGASVPSASGGLTKVTLLLGFRPDVQFAPFYLAQQEGYYADAGLEVDIQFKQAPDVMRLVGDGQALVGVADATDVMISRTAGIPVRYVSTLYDRFPVSIIGRKGEVPTDPAGLKGKTIGTPGKFGSSWVALLALLRAGGLTEDDVTIREYPQFNQADGLAHGDVDLITGFRNNEPLRLESQGIAVDQLTIDDIAPLPGPGIITAAKTADSDLVRAFAHATAQAQAAVIADPEKGLAAAELAVPTIKEDRAAALTVLRATAELWKGEGGFKKGAIDMARWRTAYDTMRSLGFIDASVLPDEMVAPAPHGG